MPVLLSRISALASIAVGAAVFLALAYFALVSWREEERRAAKRAAALALLLPWPYIGSGLIDLSLHTPLSLLVLGASIFAALLVWFPRRSACDPVDDTPRARIDERDIMFSRNLLQPGTARFDQYYTANPEKRGLDDAFRRHPGLLQPGSTYFDPVTAAAAEASFETVAAFHAILDDEALPGPPHQCDPISMTRFIKRWARNNGAVSVGVTELRDYHLYSVIGRGRHYGDPVDLHHRYAIAFTVEMDKAMIARAPRIPAVMESAQQYLNSGVIAVQLAGFIRRLGYASRAHIDGSYRVVCPLVARDAGLGEIGRMGLLMTPQLGPRVRLAVVTTDLPLIPDERKRDPSVIDFCTHCKKCATTCPAQAIPFDDRAMIDGVRRWQIDSEACFTYWCRIGADCGRCMSVCPYSHPHTLLHNLVRAGIRRSAGFRRFALRMDDFFYGRKPAPLALPDWIAAVAKPEGKRS